MGNVTDTGGVVSSMMVAASVGACVTISITVSGRSAEAAIPKITPGITKPNNAAMANSFQTNFILASFVCRADMVPA